MRESASLIESSKHGAAAREFPFDFPTAAAFYDRFSWAFCWINRARREGDVFKYSINVRKCQIEFTF